MDYRRLYESKRTTPEEAVSRIRPGDWVDYGFSLNHPDLLDRALAHRLAQEPHLSGLRFRGAVTPRQPAVTQLPDASRRLTWYSWHFSPVERALASQGFVTFVPLCFSELPRYYREHLPPVDVAMLQVAPMDREGRFSFGLSASFLHALCRNARTVIVEVNPAMPVCLGREGTWVSVEQVDAIVENPAGCLTALSPRAPTPQEEAMAAHILPLIPDGACLQLGIGGLPDAIGHLLARSDLKDLGAHTELFSDGFLALHRAGKLTGRKKQLDRGKAVYTFAMGSRDLYDFMDRNPHLMAAPVDYVNDPAVIAAQDHLIAVNSTVEVDLLGQCASEGAGLRHISGAGGQPDFLLGAYRSKGGKSFLCCPSTFRGKDGVLKSRILPTLSPGSVVTAPRPAVHYLVTEYGLACLKGLSVWDRAEAILSLAHPDFRPGLIAQAQEMGLWRPSNRR